MPKICLNERSKRTYNFPSVYSSKMVMSLLSLLASILSLKRNFYCDTDYRNNLCGFTPALIIKILEFVLPSAIEWTLLAENSIYTNWNKKVIESKNCITATDTVKNSISLKLATLSDIFVEKISQRLNSNSNDVMISLSELGNSVTLNLKSTYEIKYLNVLNGIKLSDLKKKIDIIVESNDKVCPNSQPAYITIDKNNQVHLHICRKYCESPSVESIMHLASWYFSALGEVAINDNPTLKLFHSTPLNLGVSKYTNIGLSSYCSIRQTSGQFDLYNPDEGVHSFCLVALAADLQITTYDPGCTDIL